MSVYHNTDHISVNTILNSTDKSTDTTNPLDIKCNSITRLYTAITGSDHLIYSKTGRGDLDMVEMLLQKGADPNLQCNNTPPVYTAVTEEDFETVTMLCMYKGDPNSFRCVGVTLSDFDNTIYINRCKTALIHAIDLFLPDVVGALLRYGALMNLSTLMYAKKVMDNAELEYRENGVSDDNHNHQQACIVRKILEDAYNANQDGYEHNCRLFLDKNTVGMDDRMNSFTGL